MLTLSIWAWDMWHPPFNCWAVLMKCIKCYVLCRKDHIWYVCGMKKKEKKKKSVSHCLKCDSARSHWGTAELWYDAYQSSPYFHYYLKAQLIMSPNIRFFYKEGKMMAETHPIIATSLLWQTEKYPRMYPLPIQETTPGEKYAVGNEVGVM